jgi:pimeloyl-ACP methyl ester carboxylesterase
MRLKSVQMAPGEIYYLEGGEGENLLFLHGAFATSEAYIPLLELLATQYHVVAPIHPGHGKSFAIPHEWKLDNYILFYESLFAEISFPPKILIGHSFGGTLALLLSARGVGERAIVMDSPGLPYESTLEQYMSVIDEERKDIFAKRKDMAQLAEVAKVVQSVVQSVFFHSKSLVHITTFGPKYNIASKLKNIRIPVELFWGSDDRLVPVEMGKRIHTQIPASSFTVLAGRGHNYSITDPKFTYELIMKTINSKQ